MKMQMLLPVSPVEYEEEDIFQKRHNNFTTACSMPALNYIGLFRPMQHSYMYNFKETLQYIIFKEVRNKIFIHDFTEILDQQSQK